MKKSFKAAAAVFTAAALVFTLPLVSMAGEWKKDGNGWWYQNNDGSWPSNGWQYIDGKYYYFNGSGYMLANTITPDGYQVGADGAYIERAGGAQAASTAAGLNYAMADAALHKHDYYKGLSASQIAEAEAVAQNIASRILSDRSLRTDLDKVSAASRLIYNNYILPGNYGNDPNKYYRSPYGVFITGNNTCAGGVRALGRVLDYLGYDWFHVNENQWTHQWCSLVMDGQQGYGDCMGYGSGYGTHPYAR